jgi:uncharacterized protein (TIGR02996 family)
MVTDQAAFVRAIHDRPTDPLPRLVFADWLDEHGHADQAAWLRADVRLAESYPATDPDDAATVQTFAGPDGVPSLWLAKSLWDVTAAVAALFLAAGRPILGAIRTFAAAARRATADEVEEAA